MGPWVNSGIHLARQVEPDGRAIPSGVRGWGFRHGQYSERYSLGCGHRLLHRPLGYARGVQETLDPNEHNLQGGRRMRRLQRGALPFFVSLLLALPAFAQANFPPVKIISVRSPVPHGAIGMVSIQTRPQTSCSIAVIYKSGPSRAAGLVPQVSDAHGMVTWSWMVGTRTTPGEWPIIIECGSNNITRVRTSFTVI